MSGVPKARQQRAESTPSFADATTVDFSTPAGLIPLSLPGSYVLFIVSQSGQMDKGGEVPAQGNRLWITPSFVHMKRPVGFDESFEFSTEKGGRFPAGGTFSLIDGYRLGVYTESNKGPHRAPRCGIAMVTDGQASGAVGQVRLVPSRFGKGFSQYFYVHTTRIPTPACDRSVSERVAHLDNRITAVSGLFFGVAR